MSISVDCSSFIFCHGLCAYQAVVEIEWRWQQEDMEARHFTDTSTNCWEVKPKKLWCSMTCVFFMYVLGDHAVLCCSCTSQVELDLCGNLCCEFFWVQHTHCTVHTYLHPSLPGSRRQMRVSREWHIDNLMLSVIVLDSMMPAMLPLNWCKVIYIVSLYPSSHWLSTMSRSSFTRSSEVSWIFVADKMPSSDVNVNQQRHP